MVYDYDINGLPIQTGDIICTTDGPTAVGDARGLLWRVLGKFIPGDIDHIIIYVGPEGKCVEAGPNGIITVEALPVWDSELTFQRRGMRPISMATAGSTLCSSPPGAGSTSTIAWGRIRPFRTTRSPVWSLGHFTTLNSGTSTWTETSTSLAP